MAGYLGWHQAPPGSVRYKELRQFLLDRAMEHDSPALLFSLATGYLISAKVIRPGLVTLMELIGWARAAATSLTHQKVAHLLTPRLTSELDRLLMVDARLGKTRLAWLNERPDPCHGRVMAAADRDPASGQARLPYEMAEQLFKRYTGGKTLHQLRHSRLTHLGDQNVSAPMLMAISGHKRLATLQRYVKPSQDAVAALMAASDPDRRGC